MREPPIYIWVRRTTDWADERVFRAQLNPAFVPCVTVWNETFHTPYHLFRDEVRRIAALNLSRVRGAALAAWDAIPDGALVLPVDDDDWFSPEAADVVVRAMDDGLDGCYWVAGRVEVPLDLGHALHLLGRRLVPRLPPRWICSTNNYALRKGDNQRLLENHMLASRWVASDGAERVRRIDRTLSVANRTLASITTMYWKKRPITRQTLLRKFHKYRKLYRKAPHPELAWCEPYLRRMAALMDRVRPR